MLICMRRTCKVRWNTGSRYKGLILFNLAMLKPTALTAVANDSRILRQIENIVLKKLLEMYSKTEKQVFIAMDKETSHTKRAQGILNDYAVLRLSPHLTVMNSSVALGTRKLRIMNPVLGIRMITNEKGLINNRAASIITEAALSLFHGLLSAVIYLPASFLFLGMDLSCLNQQAVDLLIPEDSSEKSIIP